MMKESSLKAWLILAIGKRLLSVDALIHKLGSVAHGFPQEISLHFEGSIPGRLFCDSDGVSIGLSVEPLTECDMQEYGAQVIASMSDDACFSNVINKTLSSAVLVKSSVEYRVVGVGFSFDCEERLFILNLGDEIFVYRSIPSDVVESEFLVFIAVEGED